MKYIVLKRSPANQVKIMKKLSPSTLFVRMFDNSCGNPNVASIDVDRNPNNGPNKGKEKPFDITVRAPVIAVRPKRNLT